MNAKQTAEKTPDDSDADRLLDALDEMQLEFMLVFQHRPEFLDTHHWNICKTLWRRRDEGKPLEKSKVIEWRKPDGEHALVGDNRARLHLDLMIEDGFLEEYFVPEISKRIKFVRATPKLLGVLENVFGKGARAMKRAFAGAAP